jgi:Cu-processing system permease protein
MLHRVLAITLNTYRESLRARILLGLAGVAFAVAF